MRPLAIGLGSLALLCAACASPPTPVQIDSKVRMAVAAMDGYKASDQNVEAAVLAQAILFVDADNADAEKVIAARPVDLFERGIAGSNKRLRVERDAGILRRLLFYIPDRILDILDIFSFDVHVGPGLYLDVHATRFFTIAAGARAVAGIGWHDARSLGIQTQAEGVLWGIFGAGAYSGTRVGTSGVEAGSYAVGFLNTPGDGLYQNYADYWSVGAGVTVGLVGVDVDLHLYQVLDLLVGLVFFDPARDDLGTTEGLDLSSSDEQLIVALGKYAGNEDALKAYRTWKATQTTDEHESTDDT